MNEPFTLNQAFFLNELRERINALPASVAKEQIIDSLEMVLTHGVESVALVAQRPTIPYSEPNELQPIVSIPPLKIPRLSSKSQEMLRVVFDV